MPLWLEMLILMLLTYASGLGIGWFYWNRGGRRQ